MVLLLSVVTTVGLVALPAPLALMHMTRSEEHAALYTLSATAGVVLCDFGHGKARQSIVLPVLALLPVVVQSARPNCRSYPSLSRASGFGVNEVGTGLDPGDAITRMDFSGGLEANAIPTPVVGKVGAGYVVGPPTPFA